MCYLLWEKAHMLFANGKIHALEFLERQIFAMLAGKGREILYGETCMVWFGDEEGTLSVVDGDVVLK